MWFNYGRDIRHRAATILRSLCTFDESCLEQAGVKHSWGNKNQLSAHDPPHLSKPVKAFAVQHSIFQHREWQSAERIR